MLVSTVHLVYKSLAPAGFSGAHFKAIAQISSLCNFHYINEGIPSLMRFWLVMTQVLRIWFMRFFARPNKMLDCYRQKAVYYTVEVHNFDLQEKTTKTNNNTITAK